jgi:cellulose synthase/poly-beta-1,6-N-acetylglucosamine synthase-like glycosyltransferase
LAAQIGAATGREVVSAPGVNEALGLIKLHGVDPVVMVVDAGQQIGRRDLERLMKAKREVPLVAIVGRFWRDAFAGRLDRCAAALLRPISVGEVARAVAQLLEEGS